MKSAAAESQRLSELQQEEPDTADNCEAKRARESRLNNSTHLTFAGRPYRAAAAGGHILLAAPLTEVMTGFRDGARPSGSVAEGAAGARDAEVREGG